MAFTQDIADALGKLGQKVIPDEQGIARQIARNGMQSITKKPGAFLAKGYKANALDGGSKEVAEALSKASIKDGKVVGEGLSNDDLFFAQKDYDSHMSNLKSIANSKKIDEKKLEWLKKQQGGNIGNGVAIAKAYYTEEGKMKTRIGATAGVMVGTRLLSGGSLTHNNSGERDIVGIPFI